MGELAQNLLRPLARTPRSLDPSLIEGRACRLRSVTQVWYGAYLLTGAIVPYRHAHSPEAQIVPMREEMI